MDTLGDDLLLLAIDPKRGRVRAVHLVRYGLMGAELIRLVASELVLIKDGRLVVAEPATATGDLQLDTALASIADASKPPKPKSWASKPRRGIVTGYLTKLANAGKIHRSAGTRARWQVADQAGLATARARLDAIAVGTGPVDLEQAAYGGLAHALQLDRLLYRGWDNRAVRKRMKEIAQGKWTAPAAEPADAAIRAEQAAISAATQAAITAAIDAAVHAATAAAAAASSG
ncbi:MAG TPA: GPP34 family phosphoprotein [Streptosporangiaceae bacterium]|jgi:hypothetical protein